MTQEPPDLKSLFHDFCEYFDSKLIWKKRGKTWTRLVLDFFSNKAQRMGYRHTPNYMSMDQVWWSQSGDIELALQHEIQVRHVPELFEKKGLPQEVRQLIDIKALRKILMVYVSEPDEKTLMSNLIVWLQTHRLKILSPKTEEYMVIVGRALTKQKRRVIHFRCHLLYYSGHKISEPLEYDLAQAS